MRFFLSSLCLAGLLIWTGCAKSSDAGPTTNAAGNASAVPSATPTERPLPPTLFNPTDLAKLKWIAGDWKGTGDDTPPFFERYRFEGDSKLIVDSFDDEAFKKQSETTTFELRDGHLVQVGPKRYAASEITSDSATFVPIVGVNNSFTWRRESDNLWTATIMFPASGDKPERQRIYKMERIKK